MRFSLRLICILFLMFLINGCGSKDELLELKKLVDSSKSTNSKIELVNALIEDINNFDKLVASADWTEHRGLQLKSDQIKTEVLEDVELSALTRAGLHSYSIKFLENKINLMKNEISKQEHDKVIKKLEQQYEQDRTKWIEDLKEYIIK